ncbi:ureidoglycolate lyase [Sorangium sp. So ce295]
MSHRPRIAAHSLSPAAYAPYGDILMASPHGEPGRPANQGTARRFDHLAAIENLRPGHASLNVSVFRCAPRSSFPLPIALLEKHPGSTQAFVPMSARRYLVVVALGGDRPELTTLGAFIAHGAQGITYRPGVWHHPMIALDAEADFVCLSWEDGSPGDCAVVEYAESERIAVAIDLL